MTKLLSASGVLLAMAIVSFISTAKYMRPLKINVADVSRSPVTSMTEQKIHGNSVSTEFSTNESQTSISSYPSCPSKERFQHFILEKVEKTGSSTLFALLSRFVYANHLNVLTLISGAHINWKRNIGEGWIIGPQSVSRADALINHARYNKTIFDKYMVKDYKYIVPVREPVSWMKSAVRFYHRSGVTKLKSADQLINADKDLFKRRNETSQTGVITFFHLAQLQWLGFDYSQRNNITAITEYVSYIVPKIDIPILTDQFDASLLILKRRLCWDYSDIFYKSYEVPRSKAKQPEMSERSRLKLLSAEVNLGEKLLYEAVNKTWWAQPETRDDNFWREVPYFTKLNKEVSSKHCQAVRRAKKPLIISANQFHDKITISLSLCINFKKSKEITRTCLTKYAKGLHC